MSWQDDIQELAAEQRAALRFWESPAGQEPIRNEGSE